MADVKVFVKDGCPHCSKLIAQLQKQGTPFQEFNVSSSQKALKEAKEKYGADQVPVLVEGDKVTIGYKGMG